jgi:hypothetical protein
MYDVKQAVHQAGLCACQHTTAAPTLLYQFYWQGH